MPGNQPATAHVEALLEQYHAGTLSATDAAQVEHHLRGCGACHEQSEQIALYQIIRAAPALTVGPELRQSLYTRMAAARAADATRAATPERPRSRERRANISLAPVGRTHGARRVGGLLSGAVALVVVALLVSVFWALPRTGKQRQTTARQSCTASATSATIPANATLADIALTSPTEGWAVGALQNDAGAVTQGLILRFSQCRWAPVALDLPRVTLESISMDSSTDGWAVGYNWATSLMVIYHYSAHSWQAVEAPAIHLDSQRPPLFRIWMRSPSDGWIIANDATSSATSTLVHERNGTWTMVASPASLPIIYYTAAIVGPDDAWFTAQVPPFDPVTANTFRFVHYHNGLWTVMQDPEGTIFDRLSAVSPTDVRASGYTAITGRPPLFAQYDGTTWRIVPDAIPSVGGSYTFREAEALSDGEGWMYGISGSNSQGSAATATTQGSSDNGNTLFSSPPITAVWQETHSQWQILPWPYTDITQIVRWTPLPDGEIWAIGGTSYWQLNTAGSTSPYNFTTVLLHYVDGAWTRYG